MNYCTSIQAMYLEKQAYDNKLCEAAQNMVLTTNQKIQEIRAKKSATMIKSYGDYDDYYAYASHANEIYSPNTKNNFCPILGNDSGADENITSTSE